MKRSSVIFIVAVAILLLIGTSISCGGTTTTTVTTTTTATATTSAAPTTTATKTTTTTATTSTSGPQYGGIFKIASSPGVTDIVNIGNPDAMFSGPDSVIGLVCGEALMGIDPTGKGLPTAKLATDWQYNSDYTKLTLTLRKGVKFHDGTNFDADAAKFNLDLYRTGHSQFAGFLRTVTSVDVVDSNTIALNLSAYDPTLLTGFALCNTWLTSPTAYKAKGGDYMAAHPVGTGPYKFVSYQPNVSVKYERFDDYWGGRPYLDGWEWVLIADPVTQLMSLKAGEIQGLSMASAKDASDLKATGMYNINVGLPESVGLAGDSAHPDSPFADIKVRQAIAHAINKEALCKSQGYGFIIPANQYVPPHSWAYNSDIVGYPYDVQKAKDLMTAAGKSSGFETTLSYQTDPQNTLMFTLVQEDLAKIGIKVKLDPQPIASYFAFNAQGWKNQMVEHEFPASQDMDPGFALTGWLSKMAFVYDAKSIYTPDDYNAEVMAQSLETNPEKRHAMIQEIMKMGIDQYCLTVPLWYAAFIAVSVNNVHDFDMYLYNAGLLNPSKVWMSK
jgi:peptide/nickel transport system substrate-binding protein